MTVKGRLVALTTTMAAAISILAGLSPAAHATDSNELVTPTITSLHIYDDDGIFNDPDILQRSNIVLPGKFIPTSGTVRWSETFCDDEVRVQVDIQAYFSPSTGNTRAFATALLQDGNVGCTNLGLGLDSSVSVPTPIYRNASTVGKAAKVEDGYGDWATVSLSFTDKVISS